MDVTPRQLTVGGLVLGFVGAVFLAISSAWARDTLTSTVASRCGSTTLHGAQLRRSGVPRCGFGLQLWAVLEK